MDKTYYLYKIICLVNQKVYIGQTVQPEKRWYQHRKDAANPKQHIHYAIRKHGNENFIFEVIACCINAEDANFIEEKLIIQYDSLSENGKGYNIHPGGKHSPVSPETIAKIKQWWIDHPEAKQATAKRMTGSTNKGNPGNKFAEAVIHGDEWKRNHSEFMKSNPNKGQFQKGMPGKNINKGKFWKLVNGKRTYY